MRKLKVYRLYFTDSNCYRKGMKITPSGVQVHSTGANNPYLKRYVGPNDGLLGENKYKNYHNNPGLSVCANAYIGKLENDTVAIYQALPWDYCCWLSGSGNKGNANKMGYVGFEICEDNKHNKEYFEEAVMHQSVLLTAWLCQTYNIPIDKVQDHKELHDAGLASNHGDIKHWLDLYGLTMNDYRSAVQAAINDGVEIEYVNETNQEQTPQLEPAPTPTPAPTPEPEPEPIYTAIVTTEANRVVNFRSTPSANSDDNIIAKLRPGTEIEILQKVNDNWSKASYNNIIGYISNNFIKPKTDIEKDVISIPREELENIKKKLSELITTLESYLK